MKLGTCIAWGALATFAVACNNGSKGAGDSPAASGAASASAGPSAIASATPPKPMHRNHRGGGAFGLLIRATHDLTLSDAQNQTISDLDDQLHADDATRGTELRTLDADVSTGIRAGKIDTAKMQSDYAAIDTAMQARLAKENAAVNGLYAALDAGQRKQLVDGIRAKIAEREQHMKSMPDAGTPDVAKMRLARMTADLTLDDAQQKQVAPILAKSEAGGGGQQGRRDAAKQSLDALLTAFAADGFDASKIAPPGKSLHEGMERDVSLAAQLLPVLKPDQREKLATQRDRMAQMRSRLGAGDSPWSDENGMEEGLRRGPGPGGGFGGGGPGGNPGPGAAPGQAGGPPAHPIAP